MNKRMLMTGLIAAGGLVLAGCGSQKYGESGFVADKESDTECKVKAGGKGKSPSTSCRTELEFEIRRGDGSVVEVKAHSREHYDRCAVGAAFPACTEEGR